MKKLIMIVFTAMVAMNASPVLAKENVKISATAHKDALSQQQVNTMTTRLHEIHKLAKTNLNADQKKSLRNEVLDIKQRLADPLGGGVYISAGALILIVILLIIIL